MQERATMNDPGGVTGLGSSQEKLVAQPPTNQLSEVCGFANFNSILVLSVVTISALMRRGGLLVQ